jgi:hypothetical protein
MAAANDKVLLLFTRKVFAIVNFTNKSISAVRIMVGPPSAGRPFQDFSHCKAALAGFLL